MLMFGYLCNRSIEYLIFFTVKGTPLFPLIKDINFRVWNKKNEEEEEEVEEKVWTNKEGKTTNKHRSRKKEYKNQYY